MRYHITYIKDGREYVNPFAPEDKDHALRIGDELVRDGAADFFRVDRVKR